MGRSAHLFGLINGVFADSIDINDALDVFADLFGEQDLIAGYPAFSATLLAYLLAVFAITAVLGLRTDETGGRASRCWPLPSADPPGWPPICW